MKIIVAGPTGMLGHKIVQRLVARGHDVVAAGRAPENELRRWQALHGSRLVGSLAAETFAGWERLIGVEEPAALVNCIGIVKQLQPVNAIVPSIQVNALLPHLLAQVCAQQGVRLVHVSTDCVFSGRVGGYTELDDPEPADVYGRTKLLGEIGSPALTLRTSIIGRELTGAHGLLEWFLGQRDGNRVRGWQHAVFSGLPTVVLAELVAELLEEHPNVHGLHHVGGDAIDKLYLLRLFAAAFEREIIVEPDDSVRIDRSLVSSRFWDVLGRRPEPWPVLVAQMAADARPYNAWRRPGADAAP